jgi:hypothetical protein
MTQVNTTPVRLSSYLLDTTLGRHSKCVFGPGLHSFEAARGCPREPQQPTKCSDRARSTGGPRGVNAFNHSGDLLPFVAPADDPASGSHTERSVPLRLPWNAKKLPPMRVLDAGVSGSNFVRIQAPFPTPQILKQLAGP